MAFPRCSEAESRSTQHPGPAPLACKPSHDGRHPPVTEGAFSSAPASAAASALVTARAHERLILGLRARSPQQHGVPCSVFSPHLWGPHSLPSPQPFLNIAAPGTDLAHTQKDQADRESHETLFATGSVAALGKRLPSEMPAAASPPPTHRKVMDAQRLRGGPHVAGPPHTRPG